MKERFFETINENGARQWLMVASAILTGLTLIASKLGFLQWITLIPLALALIPLASDRGIRLRKMYKYGFLFFMCFYVVVYHWFIYLFPLDFVDGMNPFGAFVVVLAGVFGLSLLQSLTASLLFVLFAVLCRGRIAERCPLLKPFLAAGLWVILEWSQTLGWIGVPWARLAIGQSEYTVGIQIASLFGSYLITFLIVAVNFCIGYGILRLADTDKKRALRLPVICAAAMLIFQYGAGALIYSIDRGCKENPSVRVAAIQPNISSNEKWSLSLTQKTFELCEKYTAEAAEAGAEIVLWPETAIPFSLEEGEMSHDFVSGLAVKYNVTIIAGGYMDAEDGAEYNALVCFLPDGSAIDSFYAKRHLVPFGEYVPMRKLFSILIPPLTELVLGGYVLDSGEGAQIIEIDSLSVGSLICFDSIYETLSLESVRAGADVIFLSTNDSWFTRSAALSMHNAQARLRAVETNRYVVRAANTGISSIITPKGEITESLGALKGGFIIDDIYPTETRTLYSCVGNLFVYMVILLITIVIFCDIYTIKNKRRVLTF